VSRWVAITNGSGKSCLADEVGNRLVVDHDLDRDDPPLTVFAPNQVLAHHRAQVSASKERTCAVVPGKQADQTIDGVSTENRVQRSPTPDGRFPMRSLRLYRGQVTHFADQDDIRILA